MYMNQYDQESLPEVEYETDFEENEQGFRDDDDADLYIWDAPKRGPRLPEGEYPAIVGKISAERMQGAYGEWIKITIPFLIFSQEILDTIAVCFRASKSLKSDGRMYPIVKGILGAEPESRFDFKQLEGKAVKVVLEHNADQYGEVWENVVSVTRVAITRKRPVRVG
jgi:hypothetical protein